MTARDDLYDALVEGDGRPETMLRAQLLLDRYRDELRAEQLHDPRNQVEVSALIRREARVNPSWLAEFLHRWDRQTGGTWRLNLR